MFCIVKRWTHNKQFLKFICVQEDSILLQFKIRAKMLYLGGDHIRPKQKNKSIIWLIFSGFFQEQYITSATDTQYFFRLPQMASEVSNQ